jgi:hypothetical protein
VKSKSVTYGADVVGTLGFECRTDTAVYAPGGAMTAVPHVCVSLCVILCQSTAGLERTCSKPTASDWCLMCEMSVLMQKVSEECDRPAAAAAGAQT